MSEMVDLQWVLLADSRGDYVAIPSILLERFRVPPDDRDDLDALTEMSGSPLPFAGGWAFLGGFTQAVPDGWWADVLEALGDHARPPRRPNTVRSERTQG